jgi:hypothetical protein
MRELLQTNRYPVRCSIFRKITVCIVLYQALDGCDEILYVVITSRAMRHTCCCKDQPRPRGRPAGRCGRLAASRTQSEFD